MWNCVWAVVTASGVVLLSCGKSPIASYPDEVDAAQWGTYNKTYNGQRFSGLSLINSRNVNTLRPICSAQLGDAGAFQSSILAINDTLYVTTASTTVALDASTCDIRWQHVYHYVQTPVFSVNRGAAFSNGVLFRGTPDGRLLAIDATSGKTVWTVKAADPLVGEFISGSPIVWRGKVYSGIAGSDWGIRGRMMAFDVKTGAQVWVFNMIPMGTEVGAETWKTADSAKLGGGNMDVADPRSPDGRIVCACWKSGSRLSPRPETGQQSLYQLSCGS
jgi:alcohol dehydrogenase (cytochrome c)